MPRKDVEVLVVLYERDEPSTVSDLRDVLAWADESHHVTYRLDKLEERGYVESEKDDSRGRDNQLAPRVAWTTDDGDNLAAAVEVDWDTMEIEERVEVVEGQLDHFRSTYAEAKRRIHECEEEIEELESENERLREDVERLQSVVEDLRERVDDGIARDSEDAFTFE